MKPKRERDPETGLPIISTPNGRRWAWDTIGKAVAAVLALVAIAVWGRLLVIYGLPPRVDALEIAVKQRDPMPQAEIDKLAAAIWAAQPSPSPAARKAK